MAQLEEDQFYIARLVEGVTQGITSRRRLALFTGVSDAKFTRLASRAIIARKIVMLNEPDRHGGVVFGLYGQQEQTTELSPATQTEKAEAFLREVLADGPLPSVVVEEMAMTRGFRRGVLKSARALVGVQAVRDGEVGRWKMRLPESASVASV
ncbi:hypothetical protein Pan44_28210 [Caulifigura coniformis]|uniref:Uncharacterized protein n=1 Tax=Caulifigura coniformis TaxID=2527983 RepID=A0A517SF72_9PLAN|nr:hypothetical protein [Caulifigura coniformis]QDT54783.1 hypothetical protein Pan44_28210 [Caulifigura coniformis]